MKLAVQTDCSLIRSDTRSTRYVAVSFTAPEAPQRTSRLPVNVALVLDRSGSMQGEKIALARRAVEQALAQLHHDDRFAVVVYDDQVDVLVESTLARSEARERAVDSLSRIEARGSTDLCGGWMRGCEQLASHGNGDSVSRCLLLTDGLANRGITSRDELIRHAGALRERGVQTSTFGVGADFDERLLHGMADAGSGHFYFIESPGQIPELLTSELGEALEVVMRGAALEIVLPNHTRAGPLHRYACRRVNGDKEARIELGDLVSRQEVTVVLKFDFPAGQAGDQTGAIFSLADRDGTLFAPSEACRWSWASPADTHAQARNRVVDRQVATLYAARARAAAAEHNRAGHYELARHVLTATALRIRSYAGNDPELNAVADSLLSEVETFSEGPLAPMVMKGAYFSAYVAERGRDVVGRARRSPGTA